MCTEVEYALNTHLMRTKLVQIEQLLVFIKKPLTVKKSVVILSCDVKKGQACHLLLFFVKLCANSYRTKEKSLLYFHPLSSF